MRIDKFINQLSGDHFLSGRYRACGIYRSVLHRVCLFSGGLAPALQRVFSRGFLLEFHDHLLSDGLSRNTVSFYITGLRSVYAFAVRDGKLKIDYDLFTCVPCGSVPTEKRAVSAETIALLHAADLSAVPRLERCRDFFMLSLYLQGMPFVDLAHLRKSDVHHSFITYCRRKTQGVIRVSVSEAARAIFDKYADEVDDDSPYVLPLVFLSGVDGHRQYQSALRRHNRQLKDLAVYLDIKDNLTSYVARHTWATLAYHNGVDVGVVSQGMGHHTEEMTRIYLSSFSQDRLAEANRVVWQAILRPIVNGYVQNVREEVKEEIVREFGVGDVAAAPVIGVPDLAIAAMDSGFALPSRSCWGIGYRKEGKLIKGRGCDKTKNVRLSDKDGQ